MFECLKRSLFTGNKHLLFPLSWARMHTMYCTIVKVEKWPFSSQNAFKKWPKYSLFCSLIIWFVFSSIYAIHLVLFWSYLLQFYSFCCWIFHILCFCSERNCNFMKFSTRCSTVEKSYKWDIIFKEILTLVATEKPHNAKNFQCPKWILNWSWTW